MKVVILRGSTRVDDERATSGAYIDFLKCTYKEHTFEALAISKDINKIEKDETHFELIIEKIAAAELIIWLMPIYSALVPSQVKRFIELVYERKAEAAFSDKYIGGIYTSANVLDENGISYLKAVSEDLGGRYVDSFSATIFPIINEHYKKNLCFFLDNLFINAKDKLPVLKEYEQVKGVSKAYEPGEVKEVKKSRERKITIITDFADDNSNIAKMVDSYAKLSPYEVDVVNLNETNYSHCICCWGCCPEFVCGVKDGFQEMFNEKVLGADGVIIAGEIRDRYLSAKIKKFFDREFLYNHSLIHTGRLYGVLVSGSLRENNNIRQSINGILQLRGASVLDYVTDELNDSQSITSLIERLATRVAEGVKVKVTKPHTFPGVGSQKILRDMAYMARFPFRGDYKHFKNNLFKGFPQKRKKMLFIGNLLNFMAKFKGDAAMLESYKNKSCAGFRGLLLSEEQNKK